jgi:O-antigen/teichoic acid export membrane protein
MIKAFLKYSISYTFIEGIQKGILFLITPLLTFYMRPEEYGIVSSALMIISFISILCSLSLHGAISRFYYRYKGELQKAYLSSIFIFLFIVLIISGIFLICFGVYIFELMIPEIEYYPYVICMIFVSITQPLMTALFTLFKIKQDLKRFAIFYNFYFLTQVSLLLFFIVFLKFEAYGYLLALVITNFVYFLIALKFLYKSFGFYFDFRFVKRSLKYTLPIVPVNLLSLINGLIDRYYILSFIGLASVGVFYIGFQVAAIISLVTIALNSAYVPMFFKEVENKTNNYQRFYTLGDLVVTFSCCLSVFVAISGPFFIKSFYESEYWTIIDALPIMVFNAGLTGIYFLNSNVLSLNAKLVRIKTYVILIGVLVNLILSWLLTQEFGLYGAALSTLISSLFIILMFMLLVRRYTKFKFNNSRQLLIMGGGFSFVMFINNVGDTPTFSKFLYICFFIAMMAIYSFNLYKESQSVSDNIA